MKYILTCYCADGHLQRYQTFDSAEACGRATLEAEASGYDWYVERFTTERQYVIPLIRES